MFTARHAVKNRRVSRFFFVFSSFEILLKVVGLLNREQVKKLVSKRNFSCSSNVNLSRVCRQISLGRLLAYRHKRPETLPVLIGQPDWSRISSLFLFVIVHNSKQTKKNPTVAVSLSTTKQRNEQGNMHLSLTTFSYSGKIRGEQKNNKEKLGKRMASTTSSFTGRLNVGRLLFCFVSSPTFKRFWHSTFELMYTNPTTTARSKSKPTNWKERRKKENELLPIGIL